MHDLGNRDGEAVCGDVTAPLRKQITDAVVRANPEVAGHSCGEIMTLILRSLPSDQLDQFTTAKIEEHEGDSARTAPSSTACTTSASTARSRGRRARGGSPAASPGRGDRRGAPWPRAETLTTPRLVLEPLRARFARQAAGHSPDGASGLAELGRPRPRLARACGQGPERRSPTTAGVRSAALALGRRHRAARARASRRRPRARCRTGCAITASRASSRTSIPTTQPPPRSRGTSDWRRPTSFATARCFESGLGGLRAAQPTVASRGGEQAVAGSERRHRGALALVPDPSVDFLSLRLNNSTVAPWRAPRPPFAPYRSVGSRDHSPASTRTSSLRYGRAHHALQDVSAPLGDARRRRVLDVDDERDAQRAELVEGPARELVEHPGGHAAPARRRRGDVPELDLAPLAVDVDRQREADEAPVVVERGERLARAVEPPRLVAIEPLARVAGRRRDGQAGEAQDVGIVESAVTSSRCSAASGRSATAMPSGRGAASR